MLSIGLWIRLQIWIMLSTGIRQNCSQLSTLLRKNLLLLFSWKQSNYQKQPELSYFWPQVFCRIADTIEKMPRPRTLSNIRLGSRVARKCSVTKAFLNILQKVRENMCQTLFFNPVEGTQITPLGNLSYTLQRTI